VYREAAVPSEHHYVPETDVIPGDLFYEHAIAYLDGRPHTVGNDLSPTGPAFKDHLFPQLGKHARRHPGFRSRATAFLLEMLVRHY
jgi:hypothetical protein